MRVRDWCCRFPIPRREAARRAPTQLLAAPWRSLPGRGVPSWGQGQGTSRRRRSIAAFAVLLGSVAPAACADLGESGERADDVDSRSEEIAVASRPTLFVATEPYRVRVSEARGDVDVALGHHPRSFAFDGFLPGFVNPATGQSDIGTMQAYAPTINNIVVGRNITDAGIPGRIEKTRDGRLMIGFDAGDGPVAGKCRAQLSSYAVPSRRLLVFNLDGLQLGEDAPGRRWPLSAPGVHPVLLTQFYPTGGLSVPGAMNPSLAITVDTDPDDATKLVLSLSVRAGVWNDRRRAWRVGEIHGVERHVPLSLRMGLYLDERTPDEGGEGRWTVIARQELPTESAVRSEVNLRPVATSSRTTARIDGAAILEYRGATLNLDAVGPHIWLLGAYMYNDTVCDEGRFTFWRWARMYALPAGEPTPPLVDAARDPEVSRVPAEWNPTSAFTVEQLAPWAYGWSNAGFLDFTRYDRSLVVPHPFWGAYHGADGTPAIWRNAGGTVLNQVPVGSLALHPGPSGEPAVLRWTNPDPFASGMLRIVGTFAPGDIGVMQVQLRIDGAGAWRATDAGSFDLQRPAASIRTVDFAVHGAYFYGNTPLSASITRR